MIVIYEPLYLPDQELTEPAFRPLRTESNTFADWREFYLLVEMYRRGLHRQQSFTGLMSPKFRLKTGISGAQFMEFVGANSEADVCFVNPFPHIAYISFNAWMQGETAHPGLVVRAQELLDVSGIDLKLSDIPRQGPATLCYCNFWVGTERFWERYVGGVLVPIAEFLERNPDHPTSHSVLDATQHTDPAPFLPFIIERLFSSFLSRPPSRITSRGYPIDPFQSCINEFEKDIVTCLKDEIDDADKTGHFPETLKNQLALLCRLWQQYNYSYYATHPHPHSGQPVISR